MDDQTEQPAPAGAGSTAKDPTQTLPAGPSTSNAPIAQTVDVPKDENYPTLGPVGTKGTFEVVAETPELCTIKITSTSLKDSEFGMQEGAGQVEDDGSDESAMNHVDMLARKSTQGRY